MEEKLSLLPTSDFFNNPHFRLLMACAGFSSTRAYWDHLVNRFLSAWTKEINKFNVGKGWL